MRSFPRGRHQSIYFRSWSPARVCAAPAASRTSLGEFAVWLEAGNAVQLAGQLVTTIVENREMLRERYTERRLAESPSQP